MEDLVTSVWWVAGSPCSGKTTLAQRLAADLGADLYSCDDAFDRHAAAVTAATGPTLKKVTSWSAARRLAQPVEVQVRDVLALCQEQWPLILTDLRGAPGPVVVEGAALLPEELASLGIPAGRAVWVVPTEDFQREHYAQRAWALELVASTGDPAGSFERWMQRDARFAEQMTARARRLGYPVVLTDGTVSPDDALTAVTSLLDVPGHQVGVRRLTGGSPPSALWRRRVL